MTKKAHATKTLQYQTVCALTHMAQQYLRKLCVCARTLKDMPQPCVRVLTCMAQQHLGDVCVLVKQGVVQRTHSVYLAVQLQAGAVLQQSPHALRTAMITRLVQWSPADMIYTGDKQHLSLEVDDKKHFSLALPTVTSNT